MKTYMIIPVYDTVILPDVDYQLGISDLTDDEKSRIKIDNNRVLLMPLKESKERTSLTMEDFYGLGVEAEVLELRETPKGTRIHAQTREKVRLIDLNVGDTLLEGSFESLEEVSDITVKAEQNLLEDLKKTTTEIATHIQGGELAIQYIKGIHSINEYGAAFCQFFDMSQDEKYHLLSTDSLKERGLLIEEALRKFKGSIDLQLDLDKRYNETEGVTYKRQAIRKQMGMLQKELESMDPNSASEEDEYKKKIEAADMPEEARKEADRALHRYLESQPTDPERSVLENYLDFMTSLKWKLDPTPVPDLANARKILDRDHYGLKKVKDRIIQQIAVMTLKKSQSGSILLLVGAPGTGKTSMGKSIAEALGRKYVRISLGGVRDEAEIRGHRRTYVGAMPGRIMEGIKRSGSMNPVVVLDEVDKLAQSFQGDPASALLEVLDPEQNNTFTDHYLNVPYDLSNVFFICTANSYDTIPGPLLDRMEVIQLPGYTPFEKLQIAKQYLMPRAMEDAGITKKQLHISQGAMKKIIDSYTMEAGVRGLKKQLDILCRHAATEIVEKGDDQILSVKEADLGKYLGNKPIPHDRILKPSTREGVVTGLAWTQAGGEILFIETSVMPGNGKIIITGQLGDVMKESAEIALSLLKSSFLNKKLDFSDKDIHIHVPEGAVPKDGPSAGVTLFTALVSLVTGKRVDPHLAMTGEISLRGQVLPIGGLPEKLMAAQRASVRKVLIPKDNVRDLEDVPKEVTSSLEIVPVDTVGDVIHEALGISLPRLNRPLFDIADETAKSRTEEKERESSKDSTENLSGKKASVQETGKKAGKKTWR